MSDPWGKQSAGQGAPGPAGMEDMLSALSGGQGGAAGLDAIIGQLRQAGFGPQLDSWIGTGGNVPVEPEDMRRAFGDQQLQAVGSRMGMGGGVLAAILAQLLPALIDRASPQGRMPRDEREMQGQGGLGGILGGLLNGGLGGLLGGLLGGGGQPGRGEEVAPPPERGWGQDAPERAGGRDERGWGQEAPPGGYPGKPGWPDQGQGGAPRGKPGWPDQGQGGAPAGKPGWPDQGQGGAQGGKPGWPQQAEPREPGGWPQQSAPGPGGGSDDPLGDLARSADRLGRRR